MDVPNEDPEFPLPTEQGIDLPPHGLFGVYALRDTCEKVNQLYQRLPSGLPSIPRMYVTSGRSL